MNKQIQSKLLDLNRQFYDQFAPSFSSTRSQVQSGVRYLMSRFDRKTDLLDLGCGNGTLAQLLARTGFSGRYVGVDMSTGLLAEAQRLLQPNPAGAYFFQSIDLAQPGWPDQVQGIPFDWLVCFAVLHHLPGADFRSQVVRTFSRLIKPDGTVGVSVWQWQNSTRLVKRVVPWSEAGLVDAQVDEGDVLLDWRAGNRVGLRYVHTFNEHSLTQLAEEAGFRVQETFYADGKPGNLALYQIWEPT